MNIAYVGLPTDMNIGNGKTVSAVQKLIESWLFEGKQIFSNIKLIGVEYTEFIPETIFDVLETKHTAVLFDEIAAICHKNHRISATCKQHGEYIGLCYLMSQFFRQVRKNDITSCCTAQTFADIHFQIRTLMQQTIVCEKFHLEKNRVIKCTTDKCPEWHGTHYIGKTDSRTGETIYQNPEKYYSHYNSNEIIKGWV